MGLFGIDFDALGKNIQTWAPPKELNPIVSNFSNLARSVVDNAGKQAGIAGQNIQSFKPPQEIGQTYNNVTQNLGRGFQSAYEKATPAQDYRSFNPVKEFARQVPYAIGSTADAIARGTGESATRLLGYGTNPQSLKTSYQSFQNEPLAGFGPKPKDLGLAAAPLFLGSVGADIASFLPGFGGEKASLKSLEAAAKATKSAGEFQKALTTNKNLGTVANRILKDTKNPINTFEDLYGAARQNKLTGIERPIAPPQNISPELQPLANEARKYKSAEEFVKGQRQVFHQTTEDVAKKIEQGGFKVGDRVAGQTDVLPNGVNTKGSNAELRNIPGKTQVEAFTNAKNVKEFPTNQHLVQYLANKSPEYSKLVSKATEFERKTRYEKQLAKIEKNWTRANNRESADASRKIIDAWGKEQTDGAVRAREIATNLLKKEGYDGVYVKQDIANPSFGRSETTDNLIVFDPTKIKTKSQLTDLYNQVTKGGKPVVKGGVGDLADVKSRLLSVFTLSDADKAIIKKAQTPEELAPYLRKLGPGSMAKFFSSGAGEATSAVKPTNIVDKNIASGKALVSELAQSGQVPAQKLPVEKSGRVLLRDLATPTERSGVVNPASANYNTKNLDLSKTGQKLIKQTVEELKPNIERVIGSKLSNKETLEFARTTATVTQKLVTREQTQNKLASGLKLRQQIAKSIQDESVSPEFIRSVLVDKAAGTDIARQLQARRIQAQPQEQRLIDTMLDALHHSGANADEIVKASQGVDFTDPKQATTFFRQFVKPTAEEWLDKLRYTDMLSSPLTHIVNTASNAQGVLIKGLTKSLEGGVDFLHSSFTGQERTRFAGEGPAFVKGALGNVGEAAHRFAEVMRGNSLSQNPDLRNLPLSVQGFSGKADSALSVVPRLLEGMDQFFTAMVEGGSKAGYKLRESEGVSVALPELRAKNEAAQTLFRQELGVEGQGHALDTIDYLANGINRARNAKTPVIRNVAKVVFPFVSTPTNILKQGLEYTPLGVVTLAGNADKTAQVAKIAFGATVATGAALLLGSDRMTWAEPTDQKKKNAFREGGLQPYAIKVGDTWVSYAKLHPALAFNLALVSATQDAIKNKRLNDSQADTVLQAGAKWLNFFADQSFVKNMGDVIAAAKGDEQAVSSFFASLPKQFIPLSALLGWVNRVIDPVQRQVNNSAGFLDQVFQTIVKDIPVVSSNVAPRIGPSGQPIRSQFPQINAISPFKISQETPSAQTYRDLEATSKLARDQRDAKKQGLAEPTGASTNTSPDGKLLLAVNGTRRTYKTSNLVSNRPTGVAPENADYLDNQYLQETKKLVLDRDLALYKRGISQADGEKLRLFYQNQLGVLAQDYKRLFNKDLAPQVLELLPKAYRTGAEKNPALKQPKKPKIQIAKKGHTRIAKVKKAPRVRLAKAPRISARKVRLTNTASRKVRLG